jgi:hypothetical protein
MRPKESCQSGARGFHAPAKAGRFVAEAGQSVAGTVQFAAGAGQSVAGAVQFVAEDVRSPGKRRHSPE